MIRRERGTITTHTGLVERTSEPPRLTLARIGEIYAHREILLNLVRKELKVKYTASVLGAVWSLLNPVVFLAVFSFVVKVLDNRIDDFPVFLLSGLLVWNFLAAALQSGARAVIDNANLVKKVAFPREILPLATIGVAFVDFVLQTAVLLLFMLVTAYGFHAEALILYPMALLGLLIFTTAVALWASAVNVRYRDVGHLIGLALLVWFWATPIVYPGGLVQAKLAGETVAGVDLWNLYLLNPLTDLVLGFQRALYGIVGPQALPEVSLAWLAGVLAIVIVASLVLLFLAWRLFFRRSGDFAEEL